MNKVLLIVNPKAGKGRIKKKIPKIIKNFYKKGYEIDLIYTSIKNKPRKIINEYKNDVSLVVCCGGDGTLNDLINGIMNMKKKPKISFIPLGTMNDFAKTIRLSTNKFFLSKNIDEGITILSDIGLFNKKYFNYVAAFGAFTAVPYVTSQRLKKIFGKLAYFIVAIKYINKIKTYKITLEVNGQKITDKYIYGSISNSKSIAGFEWFKKSGVKINDGKFEMLFIKRPKNFWQWIDAAIAVIFKKHKRKYFNYFQTDEIKITSENGSIAWTLDGEYGGRAKEVSIENETKSIEYVVPI